MFTLYIDRDGTYVIRFRPEASFEAYKTLRDADHPEDPLEIRSIELTAGKWLLSKRRWSLVFLRLKKGLQGK
ncbi:MAG: hypothetical protein AB1846_06045 [Chloroflexota bacterium]